MGNLSLAQKILNSGRPFVFLHAYSVTRSLLKQAIDEKKSMDLDVCVDDLGKPFLGHSKEYCEKSGEPNANSMPIWEAVSLLLESSIPIIVDCKHFNAWNCVEEVITKIGQERCLVHTFASELDFDYTPREFDTTSEWSPIENLNLLKNNFPAVTTTASAKGLPNDLLVNDSYKGLLLKVRKILKNSLVDTVCLNIPDETVSDKSLGFFLEENILPHVVIDNIDTKILSKVYVGETDYLERASKSSLLEQ